MKDGYEIEWRVDWFQGNCEFETICFECLNKRNQKEKKERDDYIKKMESIWDRQNRQRKEQENKVRKIAEELGLEIKEYPMTGQWSFGKVLDWWTTTGTAMERKSRIQHTFSFKNPDKIKSVLQSLI